MIGWTERGKEGSEVSVEVDLRSMKKEERRIVFIVDGRVQKCVIVGVGSEIRYGVWNNLLYLYFSYSSLFSYYLICFFID